MIDSPNDTPAPPNEKLQDCREAFERGWQKVTPIESAYINQMIKTIALEWFENGWRCRPTPSPDASVVEGNALLCDKLKKADFL